MAKTRKINRRGKAKPPRQGSKGPVYSQSPRNGGGAPRETEAPTGMNRMLNKSMKKPGSGTRGSGRGAR